MDVAKKTLNEIKKLDEDLQNPALSNEEKARKSKVRSDKAMELQNMDREIREFEASREKQLQEQSTRMRAGIVDDIDKVVTDRVKAESYSLVFDTSRPSLNGVPVDIFSLENNDFKKEVISILNKNRGRDESTSAPASGASPGVKRATK
jgi:outer membrane protein